MTTAPQAATPRTDKALKNTQGLFRAAAETNGFADHARLLEAETSRLAAALETQRIALDKIARWFGEFPSTGDKWDDGTAVSYGAKFGSNGERDYMRGIALNALSTAPDEGKE
jgi:hypothetical protein